MDGKNRIVKDILESVEKNMGTGENLSLEALEAHTGYSRFYLNRIFAEETGCTIHRYIMERRRPESWWRRTRRSWRYPARRITSLSRRLHWHSGGLTDARRLPTGNGSISRLFVSRQSRRRQG